MKRITQFVTSLFLLAALLSAVPVYAQTAQIANSSVVGASVRTDISKHSALVAKEEIYYEVTAYKPDGSLAWVRHTKNMLTTQGANKYLDSTIKTGVTSPAWKVGLIKGNGVPVFAITDTLASHSWGGTDAEVTATTDVSNTVRPAFTPGVIASGSVDNSASPAVYTGANTITLYGLFISDGTNTIGDTTGNLLGEASFTAAPIATGYTVNATAVISITAG